MYPIYVYISGYVYIYVYIYGYVHYMYNKCVYNLGNNTWKKKGRSMLGIYHIYNYDILGKFGKVKVRIGYLYEGFILFDYHFIVAIIYIHMYI